MQKKTEIIYTQEVADLPIPKGPIGKTSKFNSNVVGVSFENTDGTSRQAIINHHAREGDFVDLRFYLYEDEIACGVSIKGKQIGNLDKVLAQELFNFIKKGGFARVQITSIGKSYETNLYGVGISIEKYIPKESDHMSLNSKLIPCKTCGKEISKTAKACPYCGESYEETSKQKITPEQYVNEAGKSRITSFLLTLLFGPLGLLYSSIVGGIILIVLAIASAGTGVGPLAIWVFSIALGDHFTYNYNKKLLAQAKFMKE